jgi:hypothetical protein
VDERIVTVRVVHVVPDCRLDLPDFEPVPGGGVEDIGTRVHVVADVPVLGEDRYRTATVRAESALGVPNPGGRGHVRQTDVRHYVYQFESESAVQG